MGCNGHIDECICDECNGFNEFVEKHPELRNFDILEKTK